MCLFVLLLRQFQEHPHYNILNGLLNLMHLIVSQMWTIETNTHTQRQTQYDLLALCTTAKHLLSSFEM